MGFFVLMYRGLGNKMYLTQAEIDARLKGPHSVVIKKRERTQVPELSKEEKVLVGALTKIEGSTKAIEALGISNKRSADRYSDGIITDQKGINSELKESVNKAADIIAKGKELKIESIKELAIDNLVSALTNVNEQIKNSPIKAKELSSIAVDMSRIGQNLTPNKDSGSGPTVQILIHAPNRKEENYYEKVIVPV